MYLSVKEHDKLRTIVMGFEIPFRTYIASVLTANYPNDTSFYDKLRNIIPSPMLSQTARSKFGQIKSNHAHYYQLLCATMQCLEDKLVPQEINVPDVATLSTLVQVFSEHFMELINCFSDYNTFIYQLGKYHYVRNKLDHPGCKTLEIEDMSPTLNFISDVCTYIGIEYENCFWEKDEDTIYHEIKTLETQSVTLPPIINNFNNVPFSDKRIVCRDNEIEKVKTFIYGIPNALRKKSSLCIYGYGGLGKTAICTEVIKSIVQDVQDEQTINNYNPFYILFFTAKEEFLDISLTSGEIQKRTSAYNFSSCEELKENIFSALSISSFENFNRPGIIIVDNLESLSKNEREKIKIFIESMSPREVQYIITSRNEEDYEERMQISSFQNQNGIDFVNEYIHENDLDLTLNATEMNQLLDCTKGNTLVLVLSLRRLSKKIASIEGIRIDLTKLSTIDNLVNEMNTLPVNGYEIISEFMFKNTFNELEKLFHEESEFLYSLLEIFAVYPSKEIDIFTICILMNSSYTQIEPFTNMLCRYLILEKRGESFYLNSFAEKYIVQRLLPDKFKYESLSSRISSSMNSIQDNLADLSHDLETNENVRTIINDWAIEYDGDRIAAAKSYHLFQEVNTYCQRDSKYHLTTSFEDTNNELIKLERTTMHPYVKFQKARILGLYEQTKFLDFSLYKEINQAYIDCIWTIKTNALYNKIKSTKTYASILWIYGNFLSSTNHIPECIRYLEESRTCFENLSLKNKEYYQCLTRLGHSYLKQYKELNSLPYYTKSKSIGDILYKERYKYSAEPNIKSYATKLNKELNQIRKSLI